ncbi:uncharacterized protein [Littorina saxatilis]|uniref:uncharacterized protein n=1 Tax=Littorina saxatilis TaxID=31220 RepID=UPI0038B4C912
MSGIIHDGNIPTTVDEKHPIVGVIKKLDTFKREDYIKDTTLIGADPLRPDYPLVHKDWTTGETHGRQFCLQFQDEGHISKRLTEYAKDSELCVWISETLPEYFDLPVTTKPPKDVVQAFLAGVNLPIILLTVCQDVEKAREYANETASALKWRVLDFCHLDFLLLPCVVPNNFDLNDLEDEIKKQQQKLSWCHGGPTRLDENTFPTMKAATNALAGSTSVPCLLDDNGPEEMETLVMEEEWRDLMLRRIDELNPPGGHGHTLRVNLDPVVPFKEKVAEIEAMKRMSVRNLVTVVIPTPDSKLDACIRRLKQEVFDRYGVNLQIKVTTEVQEGSLQETTRAGDQTSDEVASDQTPIPSVPMSLIQGTKSLMLTNRG